jgi:diguanylate cyclase (GGDEF)-like protein
MKYDILIINDKDISSQTLLSKFDHGGLFVTTSTDEIKKLLKQKEIYAIVIDQDILTLEELNQIFIELSIDPIEKFIFILGEYDASVLQKAPFLIYDFIDLEHGFGILQNKLQVCEHFYQKELKLKNNIQKLLYTDSLTGLPNRTKLITDIKDDNFGISSLAILDINSFKEINDFYGHKIGDNVLKRVVTEIDNAIVNHKDLLKLYKFSADVYCLANRGLSENDFKQLIISIVQNIDEKVFFINTHEINVRITAGITFSKKNNKLITADLALQSAKRENKDYLVFYEELDNLTEYQNNMKWTKKLKHALENDNIVVFYQPLVNNQTMLVDKYECLVRMIDGDRIVSPFFFLEVSKKANQYKNITKIVIEKSFKEFANLSFEFSINVSYEDVEDKQLIEFIKEQLKKYNIAKRVVWEILEDENIKNYDVLIDFIKEVKALGCKVAIDDFGTGYSNFEHLLKMNVDYLKIDASLVKYIATDENSYKIVQTIVEFAKSLKLKTIAEYVENEEIFNITKKLGVSYSQGYYFSAPIDKPSLEKF